MREAWETICRETVERVLAARGISLGAELPAFAQAVCRDLAARVPGMACENDPRRLEQGIKPVALHHYSHRLYNACAAGGTERQRRAFQELAAYLYRFARFRTEDKEIARECTQATLAVAWEKFAQCRDPGAFLDWCNAILLNTVRDYFRGEQKRAQSDPWEGRALTESELDEDEMDERGAGTSPLYQGASDDPLGQAARQQMHEQLIEAIRSCLQSARQARVVIELWLNDKSVKQVAELLNTTPLNVQVMKSRAMEKLRNCEAVLRLYEQWMF